MEQIIKAYGKGLLDSLALVFFLTLLMTGVRDEKGNIGVFHVMGASLEKEQLVSDSDFTNFEEESKRAMPQIICRETGMLHIGSYNITELAEAFDYEENPLPLQIQGVCNPKGNWEQEVYGTVVEQIEFDEPGIYTVQVAATDAWNRTSVCRICIPVNP